MTSRFTLHEARLGVETDKLKPGTVSIGITTFNRPDFCVDQLIKLPEQPDVLAILDEIYRRRPGHPEGVATTTLSSRPPKALGPKLRYIEQGNLGGSGGFSRSMDEATVKGDADYVLLLDDDVVCEPEGILRAVAFADLAKQPDACRRPDVQPLRPLGHARVRRDGRPLALVLGPGAEHRPRPQLRPAVAARRPSGCTAASTSTTTAGGCA